MYLSLMKIQTVVPAPVDPKDLEIEALKKEIQGLKSECDDLRQRNDALERRFRITTEGWSDASLIDVIDTMDEQFKRIGSFMSEAFDPFIMQHKSVVVNGDLMARIEGLMRYKKKATPAQFEKATALIIGGYFKDKTRQDDIEHFLKTYEHGEIAGCIASRLSYLNADKGVEAIVYAMCKAAIMNGEVVTTNTDDVVDVTRKKYTYAAEHAIDLHPIITHEVNEPAGELDHIYGKHFINRNTSALLHALSHIDPSIKGCDLALYHVGTATRFAECSVLYIDGVPYKPFRVMAEYAIFPTLPNEYYGRVEAMVSIFGGKSPISLVRVYSEEPTSGLITGSICTVVSTLLSSTRIYTCSIGFGSQGVYINATGDTDHTNITSLDCCQRAFGRAPDMDKWNKPRFNFKTERADRCKSRSKGSDNDSGNSNNQDRNFTRNNQQWRNSNGDNWR